MQKKDRAFELDMLRGVAIVMMMFMHFSYDIRYEFGFDTFSYLESNWFWEFVHPVIIVLFVGLSGICCTFSRNNLKRGGKLLAVALAFTFGTLFVTKFLNIYCLIIFNVLHLLSLSILIYALVQFIEEKARLRADAVSFVLGLIGIYVIILKNYLYLYDHSTDNMLFLPLGIKVFGAPSMADFMPIIPWMGVFLTGAALGRLCYKEKKTLFPGSEGFQKAVSPLSFLGRHSLIIYIVHQPVIYGILWVIFKLAGRF